jgi:hypothetical protein
MSDYGDPYGSDDDELSNALEELEELSSEDELSKMKVEEPRFTFGGARERKRLEEEARLLEEEKEALREIQARKRMDEIKKRQRQSRQGSIEEEDLPPSRLMVNEEARTRVRSPPKTYQPRFMTKEMKRKPKEDERVERAGLSREQRSGIDELRKAGEVHTEFLKLSKKEREEIQLQETVNENENGKTITFYLPEVKQDYPDYVPEGFRGHTIYKDDVVVAQKYQVPYQENYSKFIQDLMEGWENINVTKMEKLQEELAEAMSRQKEDRDPALEVSIWEGMQKVYEDQEERKKMWKDHVLVATDADFVAERKRLEMSVDTIRAKVPVRINGVFSQEVINKERDGYLVGVGDQAKWYPRDQVKFVNPEMTNPDPKYADRNEMIGDYIPVKDGDKTYIARIVRFEGDGVQARREVGRQEVGREEAKYYHVTYEEIDRMKAKPALDVTYTPVGISPMVRNTVHLILFQAVRNVFASPKAGETLTFRPVGLDYVKELMKKEKRARECADMFGPKVIESTRVQAVQRREGVETPSKEVIINSILRTAEEYKKIESLTAEEILDAVAEDWEFILKNSFEDQVIDAMVGRYTVNTIVGSENRKALFHYHQWSEFSYQKALEQANLRWEVKASPLSILIKRRLIAEANKDPSIRTNFINVFRDTINEFIARKSTMTVENYAEDLLKILHRNCLASTDEITLTEEEEEEAQARHEKYVQEAKEAKEAARKTQKKKLETLQVTKTDEEVNELCKRIETYLYQLAVFTPELFDLAYLPDPSAKTGSAIERYIFAVADMLIVSGGKDDFYIATRSGNRKKVTIDAKKIFRAGHSQFLAQPEPYFRADRRKLIESSLYEILLDETQDYLCELLSIEKFESVGKNHIKKLAEWSYAAASGAKFDDLDEDRPELLEMGYNELIKTRGNQPPQFCDPDLNPDEMVVVHDDQKGEWLCYSISDILTERRIYNDARLQDPDSYPDPDGWIKHIPGLAGSTVLQMIKNYEALYGVDYRSSERRGPPTPKREERKPLTPIYSSMELGLEAFIEASTQGTKSLPSPSKVLSENIIDTQSSLERHVVVEELSSEDLEWGEQVRKEAAKKKVLVQEDVPVELVSETRHRYVRLWVPTSVPYFQEHEGEIADIMLAYSGVRAKVTFGSVPPPEFVFGGKGEERGILVFIHAETSVGGLQKALLSVSKDEQGKTLNFKYLIPIMMKWPRKRKMTDTQKKLLNIENIKDLVYPKKTFPTFAVKGRWSNGEEHTFTVKHASIPIQKIVAGVFNEVYVGSNSDPDTVSTNVLEMIIHQWMLTSQPQGLISNGDLDRPPEEFLVLLLGAFFDDDALTDLPEGAPTMSQLTQSLYERFVAFFINNQVPDTPSMLKALDIKPFEPIAKVEVVQPSTVVKRVPLPKRYQGRSKLVKAVQKETSKPPSRTIYYTVDDIISASLTPVRSHRRESKKEPSTPFETQESISRLGFI